MRDAVRRVLAWIVPPLLVLGIVLGAPFALDFWGWTGPGGGAEDADDASGSSGREPGTDEPRGDVVLVEPPAPPAGEARDGPPPVGADSAAARDGEPEGDGLTVFEGPPPPSSDAPPPWSAAGGGGRDAAGPGAAPEGPRNDKKGEEGKRALGHDRDEDDEDDEEE